MNDWQGKLKCSHKICTSASLSTSSYLAWAGLEHETPFHPHTKLRTKLYFCAFQIIRSYIREGKRKRDKLSDNPTHSQGTWRHFIFRKDRLRGETICFILHGHCCTAFWSASRPNEHPSRYGECIRGRCVLSP
jgi:sarcosine oxidase delta subunit